MKRVASLALAAALALVVAPAWATDDTVEPEKSGTSVPWRETYHDRFGWLVPDYVKVQTGGYLGMFTAFVGYSTLWDVLNLQVGFGYSPPVRGAPSIETVSAMFDIRPIRLRLPQRLYLVPLYVGGGIMASEGSGIFLKLPAVYPRGYYPPNALHYTAMVGLELGYIAKPGELIHRHSLFAEFVTIDQYLDAFLQNRESTLLRGFSTSLGYRMSF